MGANDVIALQANFDLWRCKRFPSGPPNEKNFNIPIHSPRRIYTERVVVVPQQ